MKLFGLFDVKSNTYNTFFTAVNGAVAVRMLQDTLNSDPSAPITKFASDYELYQLCEVDDVTGEVIPEDDGAELIVKIVDLVPTIN